MIDYSSVFSDVLKMLGNGFLVVISYSFGKYISQSYKPKWKSYTLVIVAVGFLSLAMVSSFGTHIEDADPLRGGGDVVTDFESTDDERKEYGLALFLQLAIPAVIGVYRGKIRVH